MTGVAEVQARRHLALLHAALFTLGFTLVFVALGATATQLGRLLHYYQQWLERIGGLLIIVMGLFTLGVLRIGLLARDTRVDLGRQPVGFLSSVLAGAAFAFGWSPCIGPILGSILLYAGTSAEVGKGVSLLLMYSLGLAVPFLIAAWGLEAFLRWFQRFRAYIKWVERVAGAVLVAVGVLLVMGWMSLLSGWLQALTPGFLRSRL